MFHDVIYTVYRCIGPYENGSHSLFQIYVDPSTAENSVKEGYMIWYPNGKESEVCTIKQRR